MFLKSDSSLQLFQGSLISEPSKFTTEDPILWLDQFEIFCSLTGIPESLYTNLAFTYLKGVSLNWHRANAPFLNFEDWKQKFIYRFSPDPSVYFEKLKSINSKNFDSFEAFIDEFKLLTNYFKKTALASCTLAQISTKNDFETGTGIPLFLNSLDDETKKFCADSRPFKLEDAINLAIKFNRKNKRIPKGGPVPSQEARPETKPDKDTPQAKDKSGNQKQKGNSVVNESSNRNEVPNAQASPSPLIVQGDAKSLENGGAKFSQQANNTNYDKAPTAPKQNYPAHQNDFEFNNAKPHDEKDLRNENYHNEKRLYEEHPADQQRENSVNDSSGNFYFPCEEGNAKETNPRAMNSSFEKNIPPSVLDSQNRGAFDERKPNNNHENPDKPKKYQNNQYNHNNQSNQNNYNNQNNQNNHNKQNKQNKQKNFNRSDDYQKNNRHKNNGYENSYSGSDKLRHEQPANTSNGSADIQHNKNLNSNFESSGYQGNNQTFANNSEAMPTFAARQGPEPSGWEMDAGPSVKIIGGVPIGLDWADDFN